MAVSAVAAAMVDKLVPLRGSPHESAVAAFYGVLAYAPAFCDIVSMRKSNKREFSVVIERDEEGFYVASVPELHGCHTQARSLDQLMRRVREAIELCLEVEQQDSSTIEFIGVQRVAL
jgi:predicted RNase H-like HicB family nuclease